MCLVFEQYGQLCACVEARCRTQTEATGSSAPAGIGKRVNTGLGTHETDYVSVRIHFEFRTFVWQNIAGVCWRNNRPHISS